MTRITLLALIALTATAHAEPNFDHISRAYQGAMDRRGLFDRLHDKLGFENLELLNETWHEAQIENGKLNLAEARHDAMMVSEEIKVLHNLAETIDHDIEAYETSNATFTRNATIGTVVALVAIVGIILLIVRKRRRR
jgi:hypothetical protein